MEHNELWLPIKDYREFGVSHSAIANIKSRKCYKEVE